MATIGFLEWGDLAGQLELRGWITADALRVLAQLAGFLGNGQDNPRHADLAAAARVSIRTVRRVLAAARQLGLVAWAPRFRDTPQGRRRAANSYWLCRPAAAVPQRPREPSCQAGRASEVKISKQVWGWLHDSARNGLAAIRQLRERRLAEQWERRPRPG
jgi:DNA-binding transcriptional MocR family regulator